MKLAEALMERADLNRKIEQLRMRITNNILVQEGEKTAEDPNVLLEELDDAAERLAVLMAQINLTNCKTVVEGKTLTELIAEKDAKLLKVAAYRSAVNEAALTGRRARGTEIRVLASVDAVVLQKKADEIAKQIRQLDNTLQMTNWQVDLIEE